MSFQYLLFRSSSSCSLFHCPNGKVSGYLNDSDASHETNPNFWISKLPANTSVLIVGSDAWYNTMKGVNSPLETYREMLERLIPFFKKWINPSSSTSSQNQERKWEEIDEQREEDENGENLTKKPLKNEKKLRSTGSSSTHTSKRRLRSEMRTNIDEMNQSFSSPITIVWIDLPPMTVNDYYMKLFVWLELLRSF
jgi:hypothetical protein